MADQDLSRLFLALDIIALVALFGILLVAFIFKAPRHSTWKNFMIAWLILCISYSVVLISGQKDPARTTPSLCITQAVLILGASPLCAAAALALVIHLWLQVRRTISKTPPSVLDGHTTDLILTFTPYVFYIILLIEALAFGLSHRSLVKLTASQNYCIIDHRVPAALSTSSVIVLLVVTVVIEGMTVFAVYPNRHLFTSEKHNYSAGIIVRTICFGIWSLFAVGIGIAYLFSLSFRQSATRDILFVLLPLGSCIIFGSQPDIVRPAKDIYYKAKEISESTISRMQTPDLYSTRSSVDVPMLSPQRTSYEDYTVRNSLEPNRRPDTMPPPVPTKSKSKSSLGPNRRPDLSSDLRSQGQYQDPYDAQAMLLPKSQTVLSPNRRPEYL